MRAIAYLIAGRRDGRRPDKRPRRGLGSPKSSLRVVRRRRPARRSTYRSAPFVLRRICALSGTHDER